MKKLLFPITVFVCVVGAIAIGLDYAYDFSDEARLTNLQLGLESEEPFSIRCWHGDCRVSIHVDTDSLALLQEIHANLGFAIEFLKSRQATPSRKGGR